MSKELLVHALEEIMRVSEDMQDILRHRTRDRRDSESRLKSSFAQEYSVAKDRLEYLRQHPDFIPDLSQSIENEVWQKTELVNWIILEYGLDESSEELPAITEPVDVLDKLAKAKSTYPKSREIALYQSKCRDISGRLLATCSRPAIIIFTEVHGEGVVIEKVGDGEAYAMLRECLYPMRTFIKKHPDLLLKTRFTDSHITYIRYSEGQNDTLLYDAFNAAIEVVNESRRIYGQHPKLRGLRRVKPGVQVSMDVGNALILQDYVRPEHTSKGLLTPSQMYKVNKSPHMFCISPNVMKILNDVAKRKFSFNKYAGSYHRQRVEMYEVVKRLSASAD